MPKFVIERDIASVGSLTAVELQAVAKKSCEALRSIGPEIHWVQTYVTADKTYCVYVAPHKEAIVEHARRSGFPANRISEVERIIDDNTAVA